jgi:hypothetical protein
MNQPELLTQEYPDRARKSGTCPLMYLKALTGDRWLDQVIQITYNRATTWLQISTGP